MAKELILTGVAILSILVAFYAINIISRLNIRSRIKLVLYWTSVIIPLLGLFLAWSLQKKRVDSNGG